MRATALHRLICALLAACPVLLHAEVRLPAILSDGMVIQQGRSIRMWGRAAPGEMVTVTLAGASRVTNAVGDGRWQLFFPPLHVPDAGDGLTITVEGTNKLTIKDVLVGEVWFCSGQSNMAWPVSRAMDAAAETTAAEFPRIRLFNVPRKLAIEPQDDIAGEWRRCTAGTVGNFSAVGYFFGRELHGRLGHVPIGLINASWGGSRAESWVPRGALAAHTRFTPVADGLMRDIAAADGAFTATPKTPSAMFNAMVAPLLPFAIGGVVWYQGEANAGEADAYRELLPLLILSWRGRWGATDLPFGIVQLANFREPTPARPASGGWAALRDAQLHAAKTVRNTGLAVAIDIGEAGNIHPRNKQEVGRRLALWALATVYAQEGVYSGPMYRGVEFAGRRATLHFDHVGSGLATRDGGPPSGFAIRAEGGDFVWAEAAIEGDTVVVSSPQVALPTAVRYAWSNNPATANLVNQDGLPASPFRTDD